MTSNLTFHQLAYVDALEDPYLNVAYEFVEANRNYTPASDKGLLISCSITLAAFVAIAIGVHLLKAHTVAGGCTLGMGVGTALLTFFLNISHLRQQEKKLKVLENKKLPMDLVKWILYKESVSSKQAADWKKLAAKRLKVKELDIDGYLETGKAIRDNPEKSKELLEYYFGISGHFLYGKRKYYPEK